MKSQFTAIYLLMFNVTGSGLGPMLVAGIYDFVQGGPGNVSSAMAIILGR